MAVHLSYLDQLKMEWQMAGEGIADEFAAMADEMKSEYRGHDASIRDSEGMRDRNRNFMQNLEAQKEKRMKEGGTFGSAFMNGWRAVRRPGAAYGASEGTVQSQYRPLGPEFAGFGGGRPGPEMGPGGPEM